MGIVLGGEVSTGHSARLEFVLSTELNVVKAELQLGCQAAFYACSPRCMSYSCD